MPVTINCSDPVPSTRCPDQSATTREPGLRPSRAPPCIGASTCSASTVIVHTLRGCRYDASNCSASSSNVDTPACFGAATAISIAGIRNGSDGVAIPTGLADPEPSPSTNTPVSCCDASALLLSALIGQDKAVVAMLLSTGLRWGELAGALIEHYDPTTSTYRVIRVHDDRTREIRDYPKGKKRRTVPVPPWVQQELDEVIGERRSGLIFTTRSGTALDNGNFVRRTLKPALLHTDIEDVTPHTFRHTYASWLIQEGVSLAEVGRLLGHVSSQTTARYAHLLPSASQQVIDALADPWGTTDNHEEIGQARGADVGQSRATRHSTTLHRTNNRKPQLPRNSKEVRA